MCIPVFFCMFLYVYIYAIICVYVYACAFIYIYLYTRVWMCTHMCPSIKEVMLQRRIYRLLHIKCKGYVGQMKKIDISIFILDIYICI